MPEQDDSNWDTQVGPVNSFLNTHVLHIFAGASGVLLMYSGLDHAGLRRWFDWTVGAVTVWAAISRARSRARER